MRELQAQAEPACGPARAPSAGPCARSGGRHPASPCRRSCSCAARSARVRAAPGKPPARPAAGRPHAARECATPASSKSGTAACSMYATGGFTHFIEGLEPASLSKAAVRELGARRARIAIGGKGLADLGPAERRVMRHAFAPRGRPAEMFHQFPRQPEGKVEAADPGRGWRSQSAKAASVSSFSSRVSCTLPAAAGRAPARWACAGSACWKNRSREEATSCGRRWRRWPPGLPAAPARPCPRRRTGRAPASRSISAEPSD